MDIAGFLTKHQLPDTYADIAQKWFIPLAQEIESHLNSAKRPFFIGINGCQGSGKSTLSDFLVDYFTQTGKRTVVSLSLDDFYLSRGDRTALAVKVHPLLATRGVPGTHNTELALSTLARLKDYGTASLPRFNKAIDDPFDVTDWPIVNCPPDLVILEGWCLGATPQTDIALSEPVNTLEQDEDPLGIWRRFVNTQLGGEYQTLFDQVQYWIMLKGPSFDDVYQWRCEQEHKLAARQNNQGTAIMSDEQVARFIQHYQRLTEHCFATLPARCDRLFELDSHRSITNVVIKGQS